MFFNYLLAYTYYLLVLYFFPQLSSILCVPVCDHVFSMLWRLGFFLVLQDKTVESLCAVKTLTPDLHVDIRKWLSGSPLATFTIWKQKMPSKCVFHFVFFYIMSQ